MKNSEAYYFIGHLLVIEFDENRRVDIVQQIERNVVDWNKIVLIGSNHFVLPSIYIKLRDADLLNRLPVELIEHLAMIYQLNVDRNRKLIAQAKEIVDCLSAVDIHPIFIKGMANILDNLYADDGERMMLDIDFLVRNEDIMIAANALQTIGYGTYSGVMYYNQSTKHYPRLTNSKRISDIEMHFNAASTIFGKTLDYNAIDAFKKFTVTPFKSNVPSDENQLRINFQHTMFDNKGYERQKSSLRDMYDFILLSKRIDLSELVFDKKQEQVFDAYLTLIEAVYGISLSTKNEKTISENWYIRLHNFRLNHPLISWIERRMEEAIAVLKNPMLIIHRLKKRNK
ncbi:MAG: nucleotidyltransferase family protein [Bacteroidales bacterium]|nr:nucleotidyltransferase family protein [Bacteroidales bacterium]